MPNAKQFRMCSGVGHTLDEVVRLRYDILILVDKHRAYRDLVFLPSFLSFLQSKSHKNVVVVERGRFRNDATRRRNSPAY